MIAHRRNDLVAHRRRPADDGEEEGGLDVGGLEDDSLSEASAPSDLDDDEADAEGSDISEQDEGESQPATVAKTSASNGHAKAAVHNTLEPAAGLKKTDTDAMLNGLDVPRDGHDADQVRFEDMTEPVARPALADVVSGQHATEATTTTSADLPHERRRREQEEYRKRRDADPTFVPNRGGFFMHDHRHAGPAANGFRPFGRGRGRGRGGAGGGFPMAK